MEKDLAKIINALKNGEVILYPTDTIWGLGCDVTNGVSIDKIYTIKNRPIDKSMIILVDTLGMLNRYFKDIPSVAFDIVENSTSPITLVLNNPVNIHPSLINSDGSLGVRISTNSFNQQLIHKFGKAIVSTSANISGEASPTDFKSVSQNIKEAVDVIVDNHYEKDSTFKSSRIIKIKPNGEFVILR